MKQYEGQGPRSPVGSWRTRCLLPPYVKQRAMPIAPIASSLQQQRKEWGSFLFAIPCSHTVTSLESCTMVHSALLGSRPALAAAAGCHALSLPGQVGVPGPVLKTSCPHRHVKNLHAGGLSITKHPITSNLSASCTTAASLLRAHGWPPSSSLNPTLPTIVMTCSMSCSGCC